MLRGALATVEVFVLTLIMALPLGLPVALCCMSRFRPVRIAAEIYVWLFRGTPLLLQLFFVYFALPLLPPPFAIRLDRFEAAVITFVLNYAAYLAEIYRAGIQSIDRGQSEAAHSLGFGKWQTLMYIIIPQAARRVLPPISNETINLVKDTALISAIAVPELLKSARDAANRDVSPAAYGLAAVFYLIFTFMLTLLSRYLEKRFSRHERGA